MARATLYAFWVSSCSWRVRAALHFKGIPFEEVSVDIATKNTHLTEEYRALNPAQKVPTLKIDGVTLVESMAIIQYLEDTRPDPSLMPKDPVARARVREICETIVSGIQPLQNIGLKSQFSKEEEYVKFTKYWTGRGLETLEQLLQESTGRFCVGNSLTLADLCFVPQIFNAVTRHKLDISAYKVVSKLYESLLQEETLKATHPMEIKRKSKI